MRSIGARVRVAVLAAQLSAAALGGCAGREASAALVAVRENGAVLATFALPRLRDLPQLEIATPQSRGAQVQRGPSVRSVLEAGGATAVERVRVEGRDPAQTLIAAEIGQRVILDITKRETLKLAGPQLPVDRWVRDVTALVVNP